MSIKLLYQKRQTGKTYKLIGKALKYDCSHRKVLFVTLTTNYDTIVERLRYHKIGHTIDIETMDNISNNIASLIDTIDIYDLVLFDEFDFMQRPHLDIFTKELQKHGIKVYGLSSRNPHFNQQVRNKKCNHKLLKLI